MYSRSYRVVGISYIRHYPSAKSPINIPAFRTVGADLDINLSPILEDTVVCKTVMASVIAFYVRVRDEGNFYPSELNSGGKTRRKAFCADGDLKIATL
jgi:hypothetical protein